MKKSELIARIRALADEMREVGAALDYFGGFDSEVAEHGREMIGAAGIAEGWAEGMENHD